MMEAGKAGGKQGFILILSMGFIFTGLVVAYFRFSPTIINSLFSNILVVLGVLLVFSSLIYASVKAASTGEVALVLSGIMLLSVLARLIPHLRLSYPPLADPYYYAISTLNITDYGTLQPVLIAWYSGISGHLHWPVMQLLTASAVETTGIDSMWFFRFQAPLLGGLFALAVFALAKEATGHNGIALISALVASASDVVIFYQSEYHPQGLALIFFVLFLYTYLVSRTRARAGFRILALVCLAILLFSHHFSCLFIALLAIIFIGLAYLIPFLPPRTGRLGQAAGELRADYTLWGIVAMAGLAYHFMVYTDAARSFLGGIIEVPTEPGAGLLALGTDVPALTSLLNSAKWGILLLAALAIIRVIRNPRPHEVRLLVLLACILIAGFVANYILWGPVDRMIAFYAPLVSVFAAMTVYRLLTLNGSALRRIRAVKAATLVIAALLLAAGFFNGSQLPVLYFKSSPVNSYYRYDNRLPKMDEYKAAGEWTGVYIPVDSRIGTGRYLQTIPFFFGGRSYDNVIFPLYSPAAPADYIMVQSGTTSAEEGLKKLEDSGEASMVYDNGGLKIFKLAR